MAPGLTGFGDWLRLAMRHADVSKTELARRAKVPRTTVYRVLNGEGVRLETIQGFAKALGVPAPRVHISFGHPEQPTPAELLHEIQRLATQAEETITGRAAARAQAVERHRRLLADQGRAGAPSTREDDQSPPGRRAGTRKK